MENKSIFYSRKYFIYGIIFALLAGLSMVNLPSQGEIASENMIPMIDIGGDTMYHMGFLTVVLMLFSIRFIFKSGRFGNRLLAVAVFQLVLLPAIVAVLNFMMMISTRIF